MPTPIAPWRVIDTRTILKTDWFTVRADRCETATGESVGDYFVIDCHDWVCVAALTPAGDLVLVRQYRHGAVAITLELPAGEINTGEDIIAAARRELLEETGYHGGEARLITSLSPDTSRYSNQVHVILIEGVTAGPQGRNDQHENTEALLHPASDIRTLFLNPAFQHSSQSGALATALIASGRL